MLDLLVVGGGIFGQVMAAKARSEGAAVLVLDALKDNAGSKPSACLMKPSWFSKFDKDLYTASLLELDKLFGVKELVFRAGPLKVKVNWVNPLTILNSNPIEKASITSVGDGWVADREGKRWEARRVVVAAGCWSGELVEVAGLGAKAGWAFRFSGTVEEPFIRPWAPYKQIVAFNIESNVTWVGDGSTLNVASATPERKEKSRLRCADAIKKNASACSSVLGLRPYCAPFRSGEPCYMRQVSPGVWVITGGGKNGTLAAGWCASRVREVID